MRGQIIFYNFEKTAAVHNYNIISNKYNTKHNKFTGKAAKAYRLEPELSVRRATFVPITLQD